MSKTKKLISLIYPTVSQTKTTPSQSAKQKWANFWTGNFQKKRRKLTNKHFSKTNSLLSLLPENNFARFYFSPIILAKNQQSSSNMIFLKKKKKLGKMENFIQSWVKFISIVKFLSYKYVYIHIHKVYESVYSSWYCDLFQMS